MPLLVLSVFICTDSSSYILAQCDGNRSSCRRCIQRALICDYNVEAGASRSLSLRRRNETLQGEITQLRELLSQVDHAPEIEASGRPQHPTGPSELLGPPMEVETGGASAQQSSPHSRSNEPSSASEGLGFSALSTSHLKVQAQPWTTVAGDWLVSELLSSFFAYDNCFYLPFVDQECFLHDMQTGDIRKADFCSPLLVNAICALRCVGIT